MDNIGKAGVKQGKCFSNRVSVAEQEQQPTSYLFLCPQDRRRDIVLYKIGCWEKSEYIVKFVITFRFHLDCTINGREKEMRTFERVTNYGLGIDLLVEKT